MKEKETFNDQDGIVFLLWLGSKDIPPPLTRLTIHVHTWLQNVTNVIYKPVKVRCQASSGHDRR